MERTIWLVIGEHPDPDGADHDVVGAFDSEEEARLYVTDIRAAIKAIMRTLPVDPRKPGPHEEEDFARQSAQICARRNALQAIDPMLYGPYTIDSNYSVEPLVMGRNSDVDYWSSLREDPKEK